MLPGSLLEVMRRQLAIRREWYDENILAGKVDVWLPDVLAVKFPMHVENGVGNMYLLLENIRLTHEVKLSAVIMSTKNRCSAMLRKRHWRRVLSSQHRLIRYVTALPRIFCRQATISARCRSYWGTAMFQRR